MFNLTSRLLLLSVGLVPTVSQAQNNLPASVHYLPDDVVSTQTLNQEVNRLESADTKLHQSDVALGKRIDSLEVRVSDGARVAGFHPQSIAATHQQVTSTNAHHHVVRQTETLSKISRQYGVSIDALVRANGLASPDEIFVGQNLQIPGRSGNSSTVAPRTQTVVSHQNRSGGHTVRSGENLHVIARQYGVSIDQIRRANNIHDANRIEVGQYLLISGTPAPAPAPKKQIIVQTPTPPKVEPKPEPKKVVVVQKPQPVVVKRPEPKVQPRVQPKIVAELKPEQRKERVISYDFLPGDTLEQVAATFGTTAKELRRMNSLEDDYKAKTGHRILVPTSGIFNELASN